jgi:hypothetical protein
MSRTHLGVRMLLRNGIARISLLPPSFISSIDIPAAMRSDTLFHLALQRQPIRKPNNQMEEWSASTSRGLHWDNGSYIHLTLRSRPEDALPFTEAILLLIKYTF